MNLLDVAVMVSYPGVNAAPSERIDTRPSGSVPEVVRGLRGSGIEPHRRPAAFEVRN